MEKERFYLKNPTGVISDEEKRKRAFQIIKMANNQDNSELLQEEFE